MDKTQLLEIYTRQQRIEVEYPDTRREVDGTVIRHISLAGERGYVLYSHLDADSVDTAISAQIACFESIPQDFEWKHFDYDPPADLLERLRGRGFEIGEPESLVVLDLTTAPQELEQPAPSSVMRVTAPEGIVAIMRLEELVWEEDHHWLGEYLKRDLQMHPDILSVYISYEGKQPASAAWMYFHPGSHFASLFGGATLPQFRGRGHYTRLLAVRAQEARSRGYSLLSVDASPMSRPILEKHGFQYLATTTPCTWKTGKSLES